MINTPPAGKGMTIDFDAFRLGRFVEGLSAENELEVIDRPVDLADIASHLDGNAKAVLFRAAGPERAQIVGNVVGSRRRLALGLGIPTESLLQEVVRRCRAPVAPVEVASAAAPVHQIVLTGADADFMKLPAHLQHADDGGLYLGGIDITVSLDKQHRNVGYRRLMIRGRKEAGIDLTAPSDCRTMLAAYVAAGRAMPMAIVLGAHPADSLCAVMGIPIDDEIALMGGLRKSAVPMVRCATIDAMVPADAEIVIEGHLDERGWCEREAPYGEFAGYYGIMKTNPVFHLSAITMRRDALLQTMTISGRSLKFTDTGHLNSMRTECAVWTSLEAAIREPVALYCPPSGTGVFNARLSMRPHFPGEARNAIAAAFASMGDVKNVFVVDDDIDVFSDEQMEWALATRFQPDRDFIVDANFRAIPIDPSLHGKTIGAKAGFDLTLPAGWRDDMHYKVPVPPKLEASPTTPVTVSEALRGGPKFFRELMALTGSRDGRDVTAALDAIRATVERLQDGRYVLKAATSS